MALDPTTAAWINAGSGLLKSMGGADSRADLSQQVTFDHSGWNVNFRDGTINAERTQAGQGVEWVWLMVAGLAAIVIVKVFKGKG